MTYAELRSPEEIANDRKVLDHVLNGIEALKEKYGDDWVEMIDLDYLSLRSAARCVLGQIAYKAKGGDYFSLIGSFGGERRAAHYGFSIENYDDDYQWVTLTETWKQEIQRIKDGKEGQ